MIKKIQKASVYLHRPESIIKELLKPASKYLNSECCAMTRAGGFFLDKRVLQYNYPEQFCYNIVNNSNIYDFSEDVQKIKIPSKGFYTVSSSDFDKKEFKKSTIYKERYVPNGIFHSAQITFFNINKEVHGAAGFLRKKDRPFTEEDKQKIDKIAPYLYFAYNKYMWLSNLNFYDFQDLEKFYNNGFLICDNDGKIMFMNELSKLIFEENNCETKKGKTVPKVILEEIEKIENISNGNTEEMFFINDISSICNENRLMVCKIKKDTYSSWPYNGDGYLVVIDIEKSSVKHFLSLTKREREVLMFVSFGKQDKEIAAGLEISIKTVQNHMEKIYRKIKVNNRTEASDFAKKIGIY